MTGRSSAWKRRLRIALATGLGTNLIRLLALTWRIRTENGSALPDLRKAQVPFIAALWHGEMLPFVWQHRNEGVAVLISTHSDGEIIARIAESLGFRTIRGSSSRGGARALIEMQRELEQHGQVAVTPDGPRGPRHEFAAGAVAAAQRTGAAIVCSRVLVSSAWRLRSWDRFVIPKPFARVTFRYAPPEYVRATSAREAEHEAPRFGEIMHTLAPDSAPDEAAHA